MGITLWDGCCERRFLVAGGCRGAVGISSGPIVSAEIGWRLLPVGEYVCMACASLPLLAGH